MRLEPAPTYSNAKIIFTCNEFIGNLKVQKSEVLDIQRFDYEDIPENLSPPIRPALLKFIKAQI